VKAHTRRTLTHAAIGGFTLVAVGLRVGWFLADHVEVFIPGVTLRRLWHLKPSADSPTWLGDDFPKEEA
jgi:hypothetical protein